MSAQVFQQIAEIARQLSPEDPIQRGKITGSQLASLLNSAGLYTRWGTPYKGGRGTFRLAKLTWKWCLKQGDKRSAECVAWLLVTRRGKPAWAD